MIKRYLPRHACWSEVNCLSIVQAQVYPFSEFNRHNCAQGFELHGLGICYLIVVILIMLIFCIYHKTLE